MADDKGKILVTGATGFIGYEVAKQLSQKGYKPRLMVRRPLRGFLLKSLDAELILGKIDRQNHHCLFHGPFLTGWPA